MPRLVKNSWHFQKYKSILVTPGITKHVDVATLMKQSHSINQDWKVIFGETNVSVRNLKQPNLN